MAQQLGIDAANCLYVGDAPADIRAGKAAGMTTVWAAWHPIYADEIAKLSPDLVAKTPAEVLKILGLSSG